MPLRGVWKNVLRLLKLFFFFSRFNSSGEIPRTGSSKRTDHVVCSSHKLPPCDDGLLEQIPLQGSWQSPFVGVFCSAFMFLLVLWRPSSVSLLLHHCFHSWSIIYCITKSSRFLWYHAEVKEACTGQETPRRWSSKHCPFYQREGSGLCPRCWKCNIKRGHIWLEECHVWGDGLNSEPRLANKAPVLWHCSGF